MNGKQAQDLAFTLNQQFRDQGGDPRFLSADGTDIRDGDWYWDNNLEPVRVDFARTRYGRYWDGWFATVDTYGIPAHTMNAERLATTHPFTGQQGSAAAKALQGNAPA